MAHKTIRYFYGLIILALSALLLTAATTLYYLMPGGLSILPQVYQAYLACNMITFLAPFLSYTIWYFAITLYFRHKLFISHIAGDQKQSLCILATLLLSLLIALYFVIQLRFPTMLNNVVCITLSTGLYTAAAAFACRIGHPF